jgi:hypothetical protein
MRVCVKVVGQRAERFVQFAVGVIMHVVALASHILMKRSLGVALASHVLMKRSLGVALASLVPSANKFAVTGR